MLHSCGGAGAGLNPGKLTVDPKLLFPSINKSTLASSKQPLIFLAS